MMVWSIAFRVDCQSLCNVYDCNTSHGMDLIFIYNAKSGLVNGALDYVHKMVSPNTYSCSLCGLTYGALGMKKEWAEFVQSLPVKVSFTYPDEMAILPDGRPLPELPVGLLVSDNRTDVLLSASDMNACASLSDLMELISVRLEQKQGHTHGQHDEGGQ